MPKDDSQLHLAAPPARRRGVVPRFFSWLFATGGRPMHGAPEELFRMRGELAVLRAEVEAIHAALGRRDIAMVEELLRGGNRRQIEALIRDRTQTVPLPDGTVLCRVLGRSKMFTDAADGGIAPHLLLDGYWEYWVTEFVCRNVARGERVIDVGAHYGYYTMLLADLVGPGGRVTALEPNPWLHWLLRRNVVVNGLGDIATARCLAVVEAPRDAVMVPAALTGPADGPFADDFTDEGGRRVCSARGIALQDTVKDSVDLVRIGCAATADAIVAGLAGVIARSPKLKILLEFDARRCQNAAAMLAALAAHFPLRFIDGDSRAKPCTIEDLMDQLHVATLYLSNIDPC